MDNRHIAEIIIKACIGYECMNAKPQEMIKQLDENFVKDLAVLLKINIRRNS